MVFLAEPAPGTAAAASTPLIAYERRRLLTSSDSEPPTLQVHDPPARFDVPFDQPASLVIRGTADDNRGVASVSVDGVAATLTRATGKGGSAGAMEFREDITVPPGATQVAVEALDRTGNVSRALLRIIRRVPALSTAFRGKRAAVIVGVSRYAHPNDGLGDLKFASRDAQAVYDLLTDPQGAGWSRSSVELLLDGHATRAGVRDALERAVTGLGGEDVLFVYTVAHGVPDPFERRSTRPLFLFPHDGPLSDFRGLQYGWRSCRPCCGRVPRRGW